MAAELQAVRAANQSAWDQMNVEKVLEQYDDDIHQALPGLGLLVGKQKARENAEIDVKTVVKFEDSLVESSIYGDIAVDVANFRMKRSGMAEEEHGHYMMVYVKKNGAWKIKYYTRVNY